MAVEAPSGQQLEIAFGAQRAVVVEVGGGLREYTVAGAPVLDGFAVDAMADGGRGQPLLPWPNRIADGQYTFEGQQLQLPIEEVPRHNAIHGLTRWRNWAVSKQSANRVTVALRVYPRPGYPFIVDLSIEYELADDGLAVRTTARNVGQRALPLGAGQHPYFTVGSRLVDDAVLRLPARSRLELDPDRRLPTGRLLAVAGTDYDFRAPRSIGSTVLDECFTDLDRDGEQPTSVTLADPSTGRAITVWMDDHYRYLQVFSGDTLAPDRRRQGLAVEPMTCPPNAFRTGVDVIVLQPDESVTMAWGAVSSRFAFDKQLTPP